MIELVVLDMAGTTVDEHGIVYRALEDSVTATGAVVDAADLQTWMGADKAEAIAALMELGGVEADPGVVAGQFDHFRALLPSAMRRTRRWPCRA